MKTYVAHKVNGENYETLQIEMETICSSLNEKGHETYCSFLDNEMRSSKSKKELIENAFNKIDESEEFVAIIKSDEKSEGLLIELGYARAKNKKIVLLANQNAEANYPRAIAQQTIEFSNIEEIKDRIGEIQ